MNDTIACISTSLGVGAISIIRVSGNNAVNIVNSIFSSDLLNAQSHTIHYGFIKENGKIIDEVLVSYMKAPKTYTKEDVLEINCHGGIATTQKILELLIEKGCRLAQPGEFTKRAFLNGRIDLIEAEGVMDLIKSKTEKSRTMAINQLNGNASKLIKDLRQNIVDVLANIEVNIDYPEYEDIEKITINEISNLVLKIENKINKILDESRNGKLLKEGIDIAIVGKPNVGKSSLLNKLLDEDKAIVTSIAGTTRDIVEGTIVIDGILFNLLDTAGIRRTEDVVEKIGVDKSLGLINQADLVLYLLNNNEKLDDEDLKILDKLKNKNHIVIINKMDLESKIDIKRIDNPILLSVINNKGIDLLKNRIKEIFNFEKIETSDLTYLTSAHSLGLLKQCLTSIDDVKEGIKNNVPIDLIEIDLKNIWSVLGNIIGETYSDELIDQLFSQFCLGK